MPTLHGRPVPPADYEDLRQLERIAYGRADISQAISLRLTAAGLSFESWIVTKIVYRSPDDGPREGAETLAGAQGAASVGRLQPCMT